MMIIDGFICLERSVTIVEHHAAGLEVPMPQFVFFSVLGTTCRYSENEGCRQYKRQYTACLVFSFLHESPLVIDATRRVCIN